MEKQTLLSVWATLNSVMAQSSNSKKQGWILSLSVTSWQEASLVKNICH